MKKLFYITLFFFLFITNTIPMLALADGGPQTGNSEIRFRDLVILRNVPVISKDVPVVSKDVPVVSKNVPFLLQPKEFGENNEGEYSAQKTVLYSYRDFLIGEEAILFSSTPIKIYAQNISLGKCSRIQTLGNDINIVASVYDGTPFLPVEQKNKEALSECTTREDYAGNLMLMLGTIDTRHIKSVHDGADGAAQSGTGEPSYISAQWKIQYVGKPNMTQDEWNIESDRLRHANDNGNPKNAWTADHYDILRADYDKVVNQGLSAGYHNRVNVTEREAGRGGDGRMGAPGCHGNNGGNITLVVDKFFGGGFIASGGNGGKGGRGGRGGNGGPADSLNPFVFVENKITADQDASGNTTIDGGLRVLAIDWGKLRKYYDHDYPEYWLPGLGGKGGPGGVGGDGGNAGVITINVKDPKSIEANLNDLNSTDIASERKIVTFVSGGGAGLPGNIGQNGNLGDSGWINSDSAALDKLIKNNQIPTDNNNGGRTGQKGTLTFNGNVIALPGY